MTGLCPTMWHPCAVPLGNKPHPITHAVCCRHMCACGVRMRLVVGLYRRALYRRSVPGTLIPSINRRIIQLTLRLEHTHCDLGKRYTRS